MEYKTLVVHLDASPRRSMRLELALQLAQQNGSHLVGLFAIDATPMPRYAGAEWSTALLEAGEKQVEDARGEAKAEFDAAVSRFPDVSSEWRADANGALEAATLSARYADLVDRKSTRLNSSHT